MSNEMEIFLLIIIGIFSFTLFIFLPSYTLIKKYKDNDKSSKLKTFFYYLLINILFIILFRVSAYIYLYNYTNLDSCGFLCLNYTNDLYKVIIGLLLQLFNVILYYYLSKKIFIKYSSKIRYLFLFIYFSIIFCLFIFSFFVYAGFLGNFIINNILVNILRYIVIFIPLLIFPIDILIIDKIKGR